VGAKQSITVDYLVTGTFDGVTPAPEIELGGTSTDDQSQIYQADQSEALGVIDPDLQDGGSIGPRCITQFLVLIPTGSTVDPGARVTVEAERDGEYLELFEVTTLAVGGAVVLRPFIVPQGAVIRIAGVQAGSEDIGVRVTTDVVSDPCKIQTLVAATGGEGPSGGPCCPPDLTVAGVEGVTPPVTSPTRLAEINLTEAEPTAILVLFGTNFDADTAVQLIGPPTPPGPNTLPPPTVQEIQRTLPSGTNAGLIVLEITGTQFPGPGEDAQGWGLRLVNVCGCSQTVAVVQLLGQPAQFFIQDVAPSSVTDPPGGTVDIDVIVTDSIGLTNRTGVAPLFDGGPPPGFVSGGAVIDDTTYRFQVTSPWPDGLFQVSLISDQGATSNAQALVTSNA